MNNQRENKIIAQKEDFVMDNALLRPGTRWNGYLEMNDGEILFQTEPFGVPENGRTLTSGYLSAQSGGQKKKIVNYWQKRSSGFLEHKREELKSPMAERWMKEIRKHIPRDKKLKILDVGCGAGFFSVLLAKEGHSVTGIDLTPGMIESAVKLAGEEKADCTFMVMDAEAPDFPDESFDAVISRNLTWTLPHARRAYQEWVRVLKKGGVLLNFDANYGKSDFTDVSALPEEHAHARIGNEMMRECEEIKRQLPVSSYSRPAWDLETLVSLGLEEFTIDTGISRRIYVEKDDFYNPVPMFMICTRKKK